MPTRIVPLDEEAYARLQARRREGESFSDVVERLAGQRSWSEVAGILTDEEADALEAAIEAGRRHTSDRLVGDGDANEG